jgi:glycogen debranching enzyme
MEMTGIELRARANLRFTYSGRSVLVTNSDGGITGGEGEGFYVEDTRLLSRDALAANGTPLTAVVASPVRADGFLAYAEVPKGPSIPGQQVYVEIARAVGAGMRTELRIQNYDAHQTARFELSLSLAADFADINEIFVDRVRHQTADVATAWDEADQEVLFRYLHPDLDRAVAIRVEQAPSPVRFEDGALVVSLELPPHAPVELHFTIEPVFDGQRRSAPPGVFNEAATALAEVRQQLRAEIPRLTTTNATVTRAWQTATSDLASLPLGLTDGPAAPIAGIPMYQRFFGRDTLTIGWQAVLAMPTMLRDALQLNAAWQGTVIDDWRDEEPGKLIHQARWGPLSMLGFDPVRRYYGDYATPPDFLAFLGQYLAWTDDRATVRALLPVARQAIDWLDRYGDIDGDGFIEYVTRSEKGVKNQGWKDRFDAIVDEDGHIVPNPIATSELQAYWYGALQQVALAFFVAGDRAYALELLRKARDLQRRFDQAFWMEEEGFYALALGPDKQQIRSIGSNAGHLLVAGIVPPEKGRRVVQRLMEPDLFSGWGIRTLSSKHVAYNPFSYHLGSVWPVEQGTFALGFGRYGCIPELHHLVEGIFASTDLFVANRLPEAIGGLPRDAAHPHPGIYPEANAPQGWSASMIVSLVQALLGMRPLAPLGLLLVDPQLPPWLPDLRLEGIRVGRSRVDLQVWRTQSGTTRYRVTHREGSVRVLRQPPPQSPNASIGRRTWAALSSLIPW